MKHKLTSAAFPDQGAQRPRKPIELTVIDGGSANTRNGTPDDLGDPLFMTMARREIAATRLW